VVVCSCFSGVVGTVLSAAVGFSWALVWIKPSSGHAPFQLLALLVAFAGSCAPSALLSLPVVLLGAGATAGEDGTPLLGRCSCIDLVNRVRTYRFALVLKTVGMRVAAVVRVRHTSCGTDGALVVQASLGDLSDDSRFLVVVGNVGGGVDNRVDHNVSWGRATKLLVLATPESFVVSPIFLVVAVHQRFRLVLLQRGQLRSHGIVVPSNGRSFQASTCVVF